MLNIAIIGAGNMGQSLIGGLIKHGHPNTHLWATDPSEEKRTTLQQAFNIGVSADNREVIPHADVVIFAVKPQLFKEVALSVAKELHLKKPLIISIAAGVRETSIRKWLGAQTAIIRTMPNTPALIGCGATAAYANSNVTHKQQAWAEAILNALGVVVWVKDEAQLDVVTALSGSGPAYFFLIMESLQQGAEALGLPKDIAQILTQQTALGAVKMAMETNQSLTDLRKQVTSPGGTTEKGISVLESYNIRDIFKQVLVSATERSQALAELMEKDT